MKMCRVCLATEKDVFPIDENFVIYYNMLTNLSVSLLDGFPQDSCRSCLETIKSFIEFREKSIISETTLRKCFSTDIKEENEANIFKYENDGSVVFNFEHKLTESDVFEIPKNPTERDHTTRIKSEIKLEGSEISFDEFEHDNFIEDYEEEIKPEIMKLKKSHKKTKITKKTVKKKKQHKSNLNENVLSSNQWYCGICPKMFVNRCDLNSHIEGHQNCRKCGICQESLTSPSQVFAHRIMHIPKKQHMCHICNKAFKSCLYLEFHYKKEHIEGDDTKLNCKFCDTKFDTPKKLSSHYVHVHSDIKYVCDVCSKGFQSRANLKSHIKSHSDKKTYVCDLCGFRCKQSSGLKDHKIRRHSAGKVICQNCKRPFENEVDYDKHSKTCKKKIVMCPICGRQLSGGLSKHMSSHNATPKYECKRCPAKYRTKDGLQSHLDRHDGNRTKQCEYCPAKFYTAAVLIKHRRVHTGEKPYVCKVCSKGFTANFNLKVHMKVHGEYLVVKKQEETPNVTD